MTWYAVFEAGTTGASSDPISTGEIIDTAQLTSAGRTWLTLAGDPSGQVWNRATQAFGPRPVPATVLSKITFVQRFTPAEFSALQKSVDANVAFFMYQVSNAVTVTPSDTAVQNGLSYCVSIGLLTSARVAVIGAS